MATKKTTLKKSKRLSKIGEYIKRGVFPEVIHVNMRAVLK